MADTFGHGIIVFEETNGVSYLYRAEHPTFMPDPSASEFVNKQVGINFSDAGVMGLSLSPVYFKNENQILYYRPLSSYALYALNPNELKNGGHNLHFTGSKDALGKSQAIGQAFSIDGTLFLGFSSEYAIGCWNRYKPFKIVTKIINFYTSYS